MRVVSAGHRKRANGVAQSAIRFGINAFVFDRGSGVFFVIFGVVAATLDHEIVDDAVKQGAVVVTIPHIAQKVFHCFGRLIGIQLNYKFTSAGQKSNLRVRRLSLCN